MTKGQEGFCLRRAKQKLAMTLLPFSEAPVSGYRLIEPRQDQSVPSQCDIPCRLLGRFVTEGVPSGRCAGRIWLFRILSGAAQARDVHVVHTRRGGRSKQRFVMRISLRCSMARVCKFVGGEGRYDICSRKTRCSSKEERARNSGLKRDACNQLDSGRELWLIIATAYRLTYSCCQEGTSHACI